MGRKFPKANREYGELSWEKLVVAKDENPIQNRSDLTVVDFQNGIESFKEKIGVGKYLIFQTAFEERGIASG